MSSKLALVIADVQNDFLPGGALGVPEGDLIVPVLNAYVRRFQDAGLPIIASRDWHPPVTSHFQSQGGRWPAHCVQGTLGAAFVPELHLPNEAIVVSKGVDPRLDSYSCFDAKATSGESFDRLLHDLGVACFYLGGLATDYCIRATALDALRRDFQVVILEDAVAGISPEGSRRALEEIKRAGAKFVAITTLVLPDKQLRNVGTPY